MSIGSISSLTYAYPPTSQQNALQQDFQSLSQAIQSGNLSAAQQAYASLTQNMPAQGTSGSSNSQNNPFQQAIASIGSALQSGNISGAQSALQSLQQTMGAHRGHHHHAGSASQSAGSSSSTQSSTSISTLASTGSTIDVSA